MSIKIETAIARVRMAYESLQHRAPGEKLYIAYSGGKDSECIAQICREAIGIDAMEINYNATGIDPPELVRHVRQQFKRWRDEGMECNFNKPTANMHDLIIIHGPPTRNKRFCCEELKEGGGSGRMVITGVRWAESTKRKKNHGSITLMSKNKENRAAFYDDPDEQLSIFVADNDDRRRLTEFCPSKARYTVNPVIDWSNRNVWDYIKEREMPYCSLYNEGFARLGCIGCPMARKKRYRDFARWPHMRRYYMQAFEDMLAVKPEHYASKYGWFAADNVWHWWMEDGILPGQVGWELDGLEADV